MRHLLSAVQFLTILPVPGGVPPARAAFLFPLVGALLGLAAGAIQSLPHPIAPLLSLLFLIAVTGGLHEDGLADVFDAFRAGRTPDRILTILKDSRIGVYGALALVMSLLLRWQAIDALGSHAVPALTAAVGASRGVMVALASVSTPVGDGLGKAFCLELRRPAAALAALQSAALPFLMGPYAGAAALCANALTVAAARAYFHRRAGGITGDCLGAICQISEITMLLIFVCPPFI
jgi:adenosylcobinamide-GDP ribazoletransferase